MFRFFRPPALLITLAIALSLTGCLYDFPPSGPVRNIDTSLLGQWATKDKAGHDFSAVVTRLSEDHYSIVFQQSNKPALTFDGWISRVDSFSILVLKSLNEGDTFGKYSLYHYELLTHAKAPPGGIGANRIRLSELQLDDSTRALDSYKLRAAIRSALKSETLLTPHDVVTDLKTGKIDIPGSIVWTKTGGVTFHGETF